MTITAEQREMRYTGIGSSDIPILLGLYEKYGKDKEWLIRYKLKQIPDEPPNEAMAWGIKLEPLIREAVAAQPDWIVEEDTDTHTMPKLEWAYAHPDGKILMHPTRRGRGVLEIKNSRYYSAKNGPSDAHLCQLQWQIGITKADYGVLAVLEAGQALHITEHEFDQELFDRIFELAHDCWLSIEKYREVAT